METRERIWRKALEMFNNQGIGNVGIREIARELEMSPGNLSYHFPKKEDLIREGFMRLAMANDEAFESFRGSDQRMGDLLRLLQTIFRNQYRFRCITSGGIDLFLKAGEMGFDYPAAEARRKSFYASTFNQLRKNGDFRPSMQEADIQLLLSYISLIARFWIYEAQISYAERDLETNIRHYLQLMAGIFLPYTTDTGRKAVDIFFR
jgi:AcrR family transcriptional regulator